MNARLSKVLGDVLNDSEEVIIQDEKGWNEFRKKVKAAAKNHIRKNGYTSTFDGVRLETPVIFPTAYKMAVKVENDGWRSHWKIEGTVKFDLFDVKRMLMSINKNTAKSFIQNLGIEYRF